MDVNFAELAKRLDDFMYDYDYYGYADDVGISAEERIEHVNHLEDALRNNEFSPMIDTIKDIIKEEELCDKKNVKQLEEAKNILKDLTHVSEQLNNVKAWTPPKPSNQVKNKERDDIVR